MNPHLASRDVESHDDYIRVAPEFARPILVELRRLVHALVSDVTESFRWRHPSFARHGVIASMAAHNHYVHFTVWGGVNSADPHRLLTRLGNTPHAYIRIHSLDEVPPRRLLEPLLLQAVRRNEARARERGTLHGDSSVSDAVADDERPNP